MEDSYQLPLRVALMCSSELKVRGCCGPAQQEPMVAGFIDLRMHLGNLLPPPPPPKTFILQLLSQLSTKVEACSHVPEGEESWHDREDTALRAGVKQLLCALRVVGSPGVSTVLAQVLGGWEIRSILCTCWSPKRQLRKLVRLGRVNNKHFYPFKEWSYLSPQAYPGRKLLLFYLCIRTTAITDALCFSRFSKHP